MAVDFASFAEQVQFVAEMREWGLSADSIKVMYERYPKEAATGQVVIDEDAFAEACNACSDDGFSKPGDLLSAYKSARLKQTRTDAEKVKRLPASQDVSPHCEQYVRFVRFHRQLLQARKDGRRSIADFRGEWEKPLSIEDWRMSRDTNPAQTVAFATGGNVPSPDPKEGDLVWI